MTSTQACNGPVRPRAPEPPPPPRAPARGPSPLDIFAHATAGRVVIQDFCPLADSLEWQAGQRFWHDRGSEAFVAENVPVPWVVNNDGTLSAYAAEVLFASLEAAEQAGTLGPDVFVLELGVGVGLFARYFLDAFRALCARHGKDYYGRLTYVLADRSERMLLDVVRHGVLAGHPGRYLLRTADALDPAAGLLGDVALGGAARPFRAVFLNYLLDCLPAAALELADGEVRQLWVRTCLARGVDLAEYTDLGVEDLRRRAASPDPDGQRELAALSPMFAAEYAYRLVDPDSLPHGRFAVEAAGRAKGRFLLHSHGAIRCLERLLDVLPEDGFILLNDYGQASAVASDQPVMHQRFAGATGLMVNFPLLREFFDGAGTYCWAEPAEEIGHIYSRVLGHRLAPRTVARFRERFCKAGFDRVNEPAQAARNCVKQGHFAGAAAAFRLALERQPSNWPVLGEASHFLTFSLRDPAAGLAMARAALALNPGCSAELWNALGDALSCLGRLAEARAAFQRALRIRPNDARARYNLVCNRICERDPAGALRLIAEGLACDRTGEYRDGLLQKQAEVLNHLANRHRQEAQLLANRISEYPFGRASGVAGGSVPEPGHRRAPSTIEEVSGHVHGPR